MGRRKIDATDYIGDAQTRATAIKKRKIGVIRKAQEYAAMTGCGVAVVFLPDEQDMQDHRRNIRPSAQIFSCKPLLMERFLSTTQFEHLDPYIAIRPAHTRKKGIEEQVFRMQKLEKLRQQHQEFNNFSYSNSSICMPNSYSFNTFENDLSGVSCPIDTTTQNLALEVQHPPPAKRGRKRKSAPISQEEDVLPSKFSCNASRDWYQTNTSSNTTTTPQDGDYLQTGCFPQLPMEATIPWTQQTKYCCQETTLWADLQTLLADQEVADQLCAFFQIHNNQTDQNTQKEEQGSAEKEKIPALSVQQLNEIQARKLVSSLHSAAAASFVSRGDAPSAPASTFGIASNVHAVCVV